MNRPILLVLLSALVAQAARASAPARFALVVGSNRSETASLARLRFADDDAVAMHELLTEAGVHSVLLASPDADTARLHPRTVPAGPPTLDALRAAFGRQREEMAEARSRGQSVEWLFSFSGHGGIAHGEGHAVLEDGRLTRTLLAEELLAKAPSDRNHVFVDACKSFFLAYGKGPGGSRTRFTQPFARAASPPPNTGFILSASSDQDSHEWERLQAGVFSYELRSALRGAADADRDGSLSYAEIGAFLETANAAIPSPSHRPDFVVLPPGGAAAGLAEPVLEWSHGGLDLDVSLGHLYVERQSGERLVDANPGAMLSLVLHLPADRPMFVRTSDGASERVLAEGPTRLSALSPAPAPTGRKGALHLAFEKLFAEPFEAAGVDRFRKDYRAPDLDALRPLEEAEALRANLRGASRWTALGAASLGVGATLVAVLRRRGFGDLSQADREARNRTIGRANVVAVTSYTVALAAGSTWLALTLFERSSDEAGLALTPGEEGANVVLAGRF